jgi:glycosyltransferase involved in cell wall biosynthesis
VADPVATIVVPTRDRHELAARAVRSALAQTRADVEVVVVDDGSTPPFEPEPDARVRLIRNEVPGGVCRARNLAIEAARGDWIAFLDDDDELLPQMVERSLAAAAASTMPPPVGVLGAQEEVDEEGHVLRHRWPVALPRGRHYFLEVEERSRQAADGRTRSFLVHNTLLMPTDVLRAVGGFDERLASWEHDDLFLRINAACSLDAIDVVTYRRTLHAGGHLSQAMRARADGMLTTLDKHRDVFRAHRRKHAHYLGSAGITYQRAGEWWPSVRATTQALVLDPRRPKAVRQWAQALAGPRARRLFESRTSEE